MKIITGQAGHCITKASQLGSFLALCRGSPNDTKYGGGRDEGQRGDYRHTQGLSEVGLNRELCYWMPSITKPFLLRKGSLPAIFLFRVQALPAPPLPLLL